MSRVRKLRVGLCAVSLAGIAGAVVSVSTASVASAGFVLTCKGSIITINSPAGTNSVTCDNSITVPTP